MIWLLQAPIVEPISGGAGWIGAGLLGLVLAWVFFIRLPANDKQVKDLVELLINQRSEHVKDVGIQRADFLHQEEQQTAKFVEAIAQNRADAQQAIAQILKHCEDEVGAIAHSARETADMVKRGVEEFGVVLKDLAGALKGGIPCK